MPGLMKKAKNAVLSRGLAGVMTVKVSVLHRGLLFLFPSTSWSCHHLLKDVINSHKYIKETLLEG